MLFVNTFVPSVVKSGFLTTKVTKDTKKL